MSSSAFYYTIALRCSSYQLPRSFPVVYALILFVCVSFSRFLYRRASYDLHARSRHIVRKRTMVIGAGTAGAMAIREFDENPRSRNKAVCLIDDDPAKLGTRIRGVKVVGGRGAIPESIRKYDVEEVIFCIPSASLPVRNEILEICSGSGVIIKTLPTLSQLANGEVTLQQVRSVSIEDLLGRTQVNTDNSAMAPKVEGQDRSGHRRRRLHRQRALPSARGAAPGCSSSSTSTRTTPTTSRWSSSARTPS